MDGTEVTLAFSNPLVGCNKLGAGVNGKGVWDDMDKHSYTLFVEKITSVKAKCCFSTCNMQFWLNQ